MFLRAEFSYEYVSSPRVINARQLNRHQLIGYSSTKSFAPVKHIEHDVETHASLSGYSPRTRVTKVGEMDSEKMVHIF